MNISVLTIRRPVLSIVLSVILVLMGVIGFQSLGVRQFPNIDPPNINVTVTYPGANADVIEAQVTEPLEESINTIDGIRSLTSQSSDGRAAITVEFQLGADLEQAANDVRDRVDRAKRLLPRDIDPPIVAKADANGRAIVVMTVQSTNRTLADLTAFGTNVLKERLQTIAGVGAINIWGERKYAMQIMMDPDRLAAYGLTTTDVFQVLAVENVELPTGKLEGSSTELTVRTLGRLTTAEEFSGLILKSYQGGVVRLSDVARVYLGAENERTILKRNGQPMIALAISPQPGANQVEISNEFYRRLDMLKKFVPSDITLDVAFDDTRFIRSAVEEVEETLIIAFSLVVVIIFLFLRSWRATFIPVVAIPVSLVATFFVMWVAGFSLNVLSLLGIVLATGIVVDDAIVVMENIFRRIEGGETPREAAEKGATEIYFAIISTTITLVVVFIPIIFLPGLTGRLFREFGATVAAAVLISAFVSLALTPMMSSKLLKAHAMDGWFARKTEPFFVWLTEVYRSILGHVIRKPLVALILMAASAAMIYVFGTALPQELAPLEDRGILVANVTAPEGTTYNRMDEIMDSLTARILRAAPETQTMISVTSPSFFGGGNNNGFARLVLKPHTERERSQMEIAGVLAPMLRASTEARTVIIQEQTISTGMRAGLPVQYVLQASSLEDLRSVLPRFLDAANADPTFSIVDVDLKFTKPEVVLHIDRNRARDLGVSVQDVALVLQTALAGQRYGYFMKDGKQYQILGQVERLQRTTPDQLRSLNVRTKTGELIPLASVVSLEERSAPPALYRTDRSLSATVSAGLADGKTIGDGIQRMNAIADTVLDERFTTSLYGTSRDFAESSSSLLWAFLLAIAFVYLVLAAQFESFVDPLTIMLTVPLALAGGALALWITGDTLNIFSEIGAVTLIGLITKNGILIVEFANQRLEHGVNVLQAATEAAATRFRPILMTSLATMLGALPIALSMGAASGSRVGLGVVVVGGMLYSTVLSLIVIPSLYVVMSKLKKVHES
ncbi:MAG: efflux RND transporter permease subunit [Chlorobi bacterium]|nr:MAG: efflux RND transporter permease subunit [Bacteroidota bacterium]KXK35582.1 MAG: cation/multidrug efflux pump [Chlorobi bacterium OLB6]MBE2264689.1 efflux RND transporter permease subunit [Flavobacteriales bacterium]MBL1161274.1 efflux RND transporter permease subunit [Chlorobiota bacterium]MBW7854310.1 efflux RND transporter permease subunit [Candidatus Kapabacteria bacterium]MCC6332028.1 efflux RND transporter permease subunit [Ignavibacteria bacterium]